jgi:hypothetical protein
MPNLPQHDLPEPFAELMRLGNSWDASVYSKLAGQLRRLHGDAAAERLVGIASDTSFAEYGKGLEGNRSDRREYTRMHALGVLERMPEEAAACLDLLVSLLANEEDDELHEMLPEVFGAVGESAIEPLTAILRDPRHSSEVKAVAEEGLEEVAALHPQCRDGIVALFQSELAVTEDTALAGFLVCSLMDLDAEDSLPLIRQAFAAGRVDKWVVDLPDVELHFDRKRLLSEATAGDGEQDAAEDEDPSFEKARALALELRRRCEAGDPPPLYRPSEPDENDYEVEPGQNDAPGQPYVAGPKIGRNDPCPCGSGKKYKKCCAAQSS